MTKITVKKVKCYNLAFITIFDNKVAKKSRSLLLSPYSLLLHKPTNNHSKLPISTATLGEKLLSSWFLLSLNLCLSHATFEIFTHLKLWWNATPLILYQSMRFNDKINLFYGFTQFIYKEFPNKLAHNYTIALYLYDAACTTFAYER